MNNVGITPEDLVQLLAPVAVGLRADGYSLGVSLDTTRLFVRISAMQNACEECLAPKEVMGGIIASALRGQGVAVDDFEIVMLYPGDR